MEFKIRIMLYTTDVGQQRRHIKDGGAKRDRTADLLRARQALSQLSYSPIMERVMGIEPTHLAWKASVLPLNYTRIN